MLVFDIPPKGTNITVSEVLEQHRDAITDIAEELGQAPVRVGSGLGQRSRRGPCRRWGGVGGTPAAPSAPRLSQGRLAGAGSGS